MSHTQTLSTRHHVEVTSTAFLPSPFESVGLNEAGTVKLDANAYGTASAMTNACDMSSDSVISCGGSSDPFVPLLGAGTASSRFPIFYFAAKRHGSPCTIRRSRTRTMAFACRIHCCHSCGRAFYRRQPAKREMFSHCVHC